MTEIDILRQEVDFLSDRQTEIHKLRAELHIEEDELVMRKQVLQAIIGDLAVNS